MSMKKQFGEIVQDITDGYCGGLTCLSDGEIRYCEADVEVTDRIYKAKNKIEHVEEIKAFFEAWCPRNNEVLFILFKDGTYDYYNVHHHIMVGRNSYLYIEDNLGNNMHIPYADIEDYAVVIKNPDESALAAIPEWFEDRIYEYTEKLKEEQKMEEKWYLYYATCEWTGRDIVIIAKVLEDAKKRVEIMSTDSNVTWLCEADEWDIMLKATSALHNGASILTVTRTDAKGDILATDKYADTIEAVKRAKTSAATAQDDVIDKEKFLSMFNVGSYYKISYTDDLIEGDKNIFCVVRFKEYLYDKEAIFENIYDHHMGLIPLITVDMLNIRNDDYTIVKIPYGGDIRE